MKKLLITLAVVLTFLSLSPVARACNTDTFGSTYLDTDQSYDGLPGQGNSGPQVGLDASCTSGSNNGALVVSWVIFTQGCPNTANVYQNTTFSAFKHRFPWQGPTDFWMASYGYATNTNNQTQTSWSYVSDCTCYPDGTFTSNGGYDNFFPC